MKMITTLKSIGRDFILFFNVRTRKGLICFIILLMALLALGYFVSQGDETATEPAVELPPQVEVITADSLASLNNFTLVGSVEAKDQARIQTEANGRVTRVNYELGDSVTAGAVIAELENASEFASLLQAEGSYEAALASAEQSGISVEDAETSLTATQNTVKGSLRSSYTTVNNAVLEVLDVFYSDLTAPVVGVSIDVGNNALRLINERQALGLALQAWQNSSSNADLTNLSADISTAQTTTNNTLSLIDEFIQFTNEAENGDSVNGQSVASFTALLSAERSRLVGALSALDGAETSLVAAHDAVRRAEIGGGESNANSAAQAQVKQALGSLRAAEAAFAKTIIRSPISGTINELGLKTGDFANMSAAVALVANNNALEITVFAGANDADRVSVGQSVTVDSQAEGVVTAVAPAIDTVTRKTEIKIATEDHDLKTGETVSVVFSDDGVDADTTSTNAPILVPITAVKFTATDGSIFVVEDDKLSAVPVAVGPVTGSNVTILSGIDRSTQFVRDARGLSVGTEVDVMTR